MIYIAKAKLKKYMPKQQKTQNTQQKAEEKPKDANGKNSRIQRVKGNQKR